MLKKRLLSSVTAICMGVTMLASLTVVNAAEKSLAPWSVYFAPQGQNTDFTKWIVPTIQYKNGYMYVSKIIGDQNQDLCLTTRDNNRILMRTCNDGQGYNGQYASPVIGFTAPNAGEYTIDLTATNPEHNDDIVANAFFGTLNKTTNLIELFETVPMHGKNTKTEYSKKVTLDKGEELTSKFTSTADGFLRTFEMTYKITDVATGMVYDYNQVGRQVNVPVPKADKKVYDLGDYTTRTVRDNSMWSIYLAKDIGSETWNDMTAWKACPLDASRDANTNGIFVQNGTTQLAISDTRPNGWFFWRPGGDGESNGQGTAIIGWTAPEAGTYLIDFKAYNFGVDVKSGESTNHRIAYKKTGETKPTTLDNFNVPGANAQKEGTYLTQIKVEQGETIYLLNDAGNDGWGDSVDMRYEITNMNDTTKKWSASNMYKEELANSPFRLWFFKHGKKQDLPSYFAADLLQNAPNVVVSTQTGKWNNPFIKIDNDKSIEMIPDADNGKAGNLAVSFDVPETGFYKVDFDVTNLQPGEGAGAGCFVSTISGRAKEMTEIAATPTIRVGNNSGAISKIISVTAGDKVMLNVNSVVDAYQIDLKCHYTITKLEKFNYDYKQDGAIVKSVADLKEGKTLTANLNYIDTKAQNVTILVATFNASGTMTSVGVSEPVTSTAGQPTLVSASLTVPQITPGTVVKTFVVDGINTLVPLTGATEIK